MTLVAYHSDALFSPRRFGLTRYAVDLLAALSAHERFQCLPYSTRFRAVEDLPPAWRAAARLPKVSHRKSVLGAWLFHQPRVEQHVPEADVVHSVELDYPVSTRRPWVVTVHDLGPLSHPEFFGKARPWLRRAGLNRALSRADVIVAVSTATAEAIQHVAGQSLGDRLQVVPEGVGPEFFDAPSEACAAALATRVPLDRPFLLWTGSINPRKNLARTIAAFEQVAADLAVDLVITGGIGWDASPDLERIKASPLGARIHLAGRVTDEELRVLYRRAAAFVYCSLLEGFGLPILEAMAAGCPVVTSDRSSMPEVAGDCATLVDPLDVAAIAEGLRRSVLDRDAVAAEVVRGRERAASFQWSTAADRMASIYGDLAAGRR